MGEDGLVFEICTRLVIVGESTQVIQVVTYILYQCGARLQLFRLGQIHE